MRVAILFAAGLFAPGCSNDRAPTRVKPDAVTAPRSASAPAPIAPAVVHASCEELRAQFRAASRTLDMGCQSDADCTLQWSAFNCYAPHGPKAEVSPLKAIDAQMKRRGCPEVDCEPPPKQACEDGTCDWDL